MDEREVGRVARKAAESVYGVVEVVGPGWLDRTLARLRLGTSGVAVTTTPTLAVTVDLRVAAGVPRAQVAANVAQQVQYLVERDLGRRIDRLVVRIDGQPGSAAPAVSDDETTSR